MILDINDDRRANKPWLPEDDRDVTSGLVVEGHDGKPCCKLHGAMSRVDQHERIYRCMEFKCGVGARWVGNSKEQNIAFRKSWDARVEAAAS